MKLAPSLENTLDAHCVVLHGARPDDDASIIEDGLELVAGLRDLDGRIDLENANRDGG
jgi:hypothetical protein